MLGTLTRYALALAIPSSGFGTLAANLIAVALAMVLMVFMERRGSTHQRHFWLPGFCAGLTTFSAVTLLTLKPSDGGAMYIGATLVASLAIIAILMPIARKLIPVRA